MSGSPPAPWVPWISGPRPCCAINKLLNYSAAGAMVVLHGGPALCFCVPCLAWAGTCECRTAWRRRLRAQTVLPISLDPRAFGSQDLVLESLAAVPSCARSAALCSWQVINLLCSLWLVSAGVMPALDCLARRARARTVPILSRLCPWPSVPLPLGLGPLTHETWFLSPRCLPFLPLARGASFLPP